MMNVFSKWVGCLAIILSSASASATWSEYKTKVISEYRSGPANYHQVYGNIINTVVTIEDFWLRTNDGQVIKVMTDYMTIDLQDLVKYGRGLLIDTRKVNFPRGVSEIDVVEIETKVASVRKAYYNSADGTQCTLKVPKYLNFYTLAPIRMGKAEYLVKIGKVVNGVEVGFSPLESIQIDVTTRKTQKYECCIGWFGFGRSCEPIGRPKTTTKLTCELANRRQPILRIIRRIDEA